MSWYTVKINLDEFQNRILYSREPWLNTPAALLTELWSVIGFTEDQNKSFWIYHFYFQYASFSQHHIIFCCIIDNFCEL